MNILETQKDKLKEDTLNALLRLILSIENISFKIEDIPKSAANFILPIQSGFFTDDNKNLTGYMLQAYIVKELLSNREYTSYYFFKSVERSISKNLLKVFLLKS